MPNEQPAADGANTPLADEEYEGLTPAHLSTKAELNQWEALNIAQAHEWISRRRPDDVLNVEFLRELHRRMFGQTWTWAGEFRRSNKNTSPYDWTQVPVLLRELVENTRAQHAACDKTPDAIDDIATRFHHQVVRIHPWPNGNGRHSRLATDLLLQHWGRPPFTWGSKADLTSVGAARSRYIEALRRADAGDFQPLREFVRS